MPHISSALALFENLLCGHMWVASSRTSQISMTPSHNWSALISRKYHQAKSSSFHITKKNSIMIIDITLVYATVIPYVVVEIAHHPFSIHNYNRFRFRIRQNRTFTRAKPRLKSRHTPAGARASCPNLPHFGPLHCLSSCQKATQ